MKLDNFLKKSISFLFPALFFLVPLFFTSVNSELFEFNKMILVYAFATLITGVWGSRMVLQKKFLFKKSFLDLPLVLFLASQILSTIFSIDLHTSLFGYYSRFNGGLFSTISYLALYWAFVSNCETKDVKNSLKFSLISVAIVSIYGILEHFGHSFSCLMFSGTFDVSCWVQKVQERVFATLGQPNWLAAYLSILIPVTLFYTLRCHSGESRNLQNKSYRFQIKSGMTSILTALLFSCLLFTQSRSGFLGFILSAVVFWGIIFFQNRHQLKKVIKPFLILNSIFLILIIIFGSPFQQINKYFSLSSHVTRVSTHNSPSQPDPQLTTQNPPSSLDGGISESGDIRRIVWKGAFDIFLYYPILGSGVETFAYSYYYFRPMEHNLVSEWDFLYNKAHNEYLNYLSTTGILGLGTYLVFIGSFILYVLMSFPRKRESTQKENLHRFQVKPGMTNENSELLILAFALFAGWLSLLVTNFFGFSVVVTSLYFFLIPAFIVVLSSTSIPYSLTSNPSFKPSSKSLPPKSLNPLVFIPILSTFYILNSIFNQWRADLAYADGQKLSKAGKYYEAYQKLLDAKKLNPFEPVFLNELSSNTANLALLADTQKNSTTAAELSDLAILYSDNAKLISPKNINILKTRIKVFYTLSAFKPVYLQKAIDTLLETIKLSPTDPKLVYNLGLLYGKDNQGSLAIETIEKAVSMKQNYLDARNALSIFYEDAGEKEKALEQLKLILKISPDDKEIQKRIENLKSEIK